MTEDDLKAIEMRHKAAMEGPWRAGRAALADMALQDIPALIAEVRRLREEIEDIQIQHSHDMHALAGEP